MADHILITGGAGFIGSHLADELLSSGYRVRVLDNLTEQVHGPQQQPPDYLSSDVELIIGDVRDPEAVELALEGVDAVFHFAAMVGVGQSMYQARDYVSVNDLGTATLLQALMHRPLERLVVASSMSLYGEGMYVTSEGHLVEGHLRSLEQLRDNDWNLRDARGELMIPVPTPESKPPALASVYALTKYAQERMCLLMGQAYGIPTVALRFFNAYGTRQSLSNPYTGVLAIFASRLLNERRPVVFEDGLQKRDFVHVRDVARACRLALESEEAPGLALNVGSGRIYTILEIARKLISILGREPLEPEISGKFRTGDIRNCFADISLARGVLGYAPQVPLEEGLAELAEWLNHQMAEDYFDEARRELDARGLTA
ncbi:MAG: SDR family NAD(P)-dependent oxidoreductase [Candidatus Zixiibacteriota bacterium]|nr:MAG: SDR family NAD(P)-dependent oxidoreductase [candidate division Zixibacteria bacterium]